MLPQPCFLSHLPAGPGLCRPPRQLVAFAAAGLDLVRIHDDYRRLRRLGVPVSTAEILTLNLAGICFSAVERIRAGQIVPADQLRAGATGQGEQNG